MFQKFTENIMYKIHTICLKLKHDYNNRLNKKELQCVSFLHIDKRRFFPFIVILGRAIFKIKYVY